MTTQTWHDWYQDSLYVAFVEEPDDDFPVPGWCIACESHGQVTGGIATRMEAYRELRRMVADIEREGAALPD